MAGLDGRLVAWRRTDGDGTGVLRVTAHRDGWRFDVHSDPTHRTYDLWVDQDGLVIEYAGFATRR